MVGGMSDQPFSTSVGSADGQPGGGGGMRNRRHADWLLSLRLVTETAAAENVPDGQQPGREDAAGMYVEIGRDSTRIPHPASRIPPPRELTLCVFSFIPPVCPVAAKVLAKAVVAASLSETMNREVNRVH